MELPTKKKKKSEMSAFFPSTSNTSDYDSDDSYCSDLKMYAKKQKKCKLNLQEIEIKFEFFKNIFYKDQIKELEDKLVKLKLEKRLAVTIELRKFKLKNLEHKFNSEKQSIKEIYKNQAEMLYDMMITDYDENIDQLKAALNEIDLEATLWLGRNLIHSRGDRYGYPYGYIEPDLIPKVTPRPRINYMLKEHEIHEDWIAIKKLMSPSKQKEVAEKINNKNYKI
ncbi:Sds3-like [Cinara cedri]|uniref:Sds3-like n=1 Tax=Cinara cedri TaxID=506608 RepID=A0A5E4MS19_9HEMI|nr:Sds3-like [Cinara cedri]